VEELMEPIMTTKTFAVTAASGHVGGYAARDLLAAGHRVRVMGRHCL